MTQGSQRHREHLSPAIALAIFLLILCLGSALRLWALDASPLWWDEGNNAYFAHRNLRDVVIMSRLTRDTDPPVHRLALRFWLRALGSSAFNLRLFSVLWSLLTIPLLYHWARRLAGARVGLLAAALFALSPMCIYYAREAKGYSLATFLSSLSTYAWLYPIDKPQHRLWSVSWMVYVLAGALAVGTHYYVALLSAAQGLWLTGSIVQSRATGWKGRLCRWASGQLVMVALIAPWVLLTWSSALAGARGLPVEGGSMGLGEYAIKVGLALAAGPYGTNWPAIGALAILGLCSGLSLRSKIPQRFLLWAIVGIPLGLGYILQRAIPFVEARFFLYMLPALFILAATGMVGLGRLGILPMLALLICWGLALPGAYTPLAPPEEDLRPLAAHIQAAGQSGDHVIVGYIWQEGMLRMYAPDLAVDYELGWYTPDTVADEMRALFREHPRIWLLSYRVPLQHENNPAGWWLEHHAARALYAEFGHNRLALYAPPCAPPEQGAPTVTLGDAVMMRYEPLRTREGIEAGDILTFTLAWSMREPVDAPITVFVHLVDGNGIPRSQNDRLPMNGLRPFSSLSVSESLYDCRALFLPQDLPSGSYELWVGLYDTTSGKRWPANGPGAANDHVNLGLVMLR